MKKEKFEVGEIIIDNAGAVDSFSDSLKKIVIIIWIILLRIPIKELS